MIDNLTEAIAHAKEKARELNNTADNWKWLSDEKGLDLPSDYEPCKKCASEHEQLASWLEELQERREADRWIPVSERLPDTDGRYLVLLEKGYAEDYSLPREQIENFEVEEGSFGVWHENYNMRTLGYLDSEWSAIPVTAWRPLPKAPESEDK